VRCTEGSRSARGTHKLKGAEGGASEDVEGKRARVGYSLSVERGGRDK
jgi:hypothetical protein